MAEYITTDHRLLKPTHRPPTTYRQVKSALIITFNVDLVLRLQLLISINVGYKITCIRIFHSYANEPLKRRMVIPPSIRFLSSSLPQNGGENYELDTAIFGITVLLFKLLPCVHRIESLFTFEKPKHCTAVNFKP